MKNLAKQLKKEVLTRKTEKLNSINTIDFCDAKQLPWYLSQLLPKSKEKHIFASVTELKDYLKKRLEIHIVKKIESLEKQLIFSESLQPLTELTISVEWKKSSMWGMNPTAEVVVNGVGRISSGSISGCGYDKQSTAVANVLNQVPQLIKLMYEFKNKPKNVMQKNNDVFGYGSGYGILPSFEGGVGVSCYNSILNKIGYKFETITSGKTFDVFKVSKI